ncbi:MAG: DUF429 domain-containing protein [Campylobacterota bacterium]|nr:DUF429 domain-containing protein [Campylobacterota bacterium]
MKILGIDPAPAKKSIIFDGREFIEKTPKELKVYIDNLNEDTFISWDAPLSAAVYEGDFSLTIRQIERFFNRQSKTAKNLGIPKGISTLGYSGCPHWTISQYIFGYPVINESFLKKLKFDLLMENSEINNKNIFKITESHPALSLWIVLKEDLKNNELFKDSWQYKGYSQSDKNITKRREIITKSLMKKEFVQEVEFNKEITIDSDDKLDAFVCYILGSHLVNKTAKAKILGDKVKGSFLIPYDKVIFEVFNL